MTRQLDSTDAAPTVSREQLGSLPGGAPVAVFTLENRHGVTVRIMEYGGIVLSISVPDRAGHAEDVTLGYQALEEYLHDTRYAGALIGRYANRIAGGRFTLDGRVHMLGRNDWPNHLHGGAHGFHRVLWHGEPVKSAGSAGVVLRHASPEGHESYPGALAVSARCALDDDNTLTFAFHATTDAPTPVSFTQHSYFNLAAGRSAGAEDHELTIHASRYAPVGEGLIPTGELVPVAGTPFDFTKPAAIGARLGQADPQLALAGCFDHCFALDHPATGSAPVPAARLRDPLSGRVLEIASTLPALQFYSGVTMPPRAGSDVVRRGVALEAQRFPDAPNQPAFPPAILRPGEVFAPRIVYRFSVEGAGEPAEG